MDRMHKKFFPLRSKSTGDRHTERKRGLALRREREARFISKHYMGAHPPQPFLSGASLFVSSAQSLSHPAPRPDVLFPGTPLQVVHQAANMVAVILNSN